MRFSTLVIRSQQGFFAHSLTPAPASLCLLPPSQFVSRNAQLRVEAKQATRRAADAERRADNLVEASKRKEADLLQAVAKLQAELAVLRGSDSTPTSSDAALEVAMITQATTHHPKGHPNPETQAASSVAKAPPTSTHTTLVAPSPASASVAPATKRAASDSEVPSSLASVASDRLCADDEPVDEMSAYARSPERSQRTWLMSAMAKAEQDEEAGHLFSGGSHQDSWTEAAALESDAELLMIDEQVSARRSANPVTPDVPIEAAIAASLNAGFDTREDGRSPGGSRVFSTAVSPHPRKTSRQPPSSAGAKAQVESTGNGAARIISPTSTTQPLAPDAAGASVPSQSKAKAEKKSSLLLRAGLGLARLTVRRRSSSEVA